MTQRNTRKTTEEFILEVKQIRDDIEVISEYPVNRRTKMEILCKKCGTPFWLTPREILHGAQCPDCRIYNNKNTRTYAKYILDLLENNNAYRNDLFEIIDDDINMDDKIKRDRRLNCHCKECDKKWSTAASNLLSGSGCDHCNRIKGSKKRKSKNCTLDTFEFFKRVLDANPNNFCLDFYTNERSKIKTQCGNCGYIWYPKTTTLLNGGGCPKCNKKSKGECKIENYLVNNNIEYEAQKTFKGLNGTRGRPLSYDFYLPEFNLLVEYQGEFHDGSVPDIYQSLECKKRQYEHDRRKREYAKTHNIDLLEIWYKDFKNTEIVLENKLKQIVDIWFKKTK